MRLAIKSRENFLSGLMFIGFGLAAVIISRDYPAGTAMRMGPGYFPTMIGGLLILLGAIISGVSLANDGGTERSTGFAWRPLILLSLAFVLFGITMESLGFVPALVILIMTAALAGKEFRLIEALILMVILIVAAIAIFIYGIELPFQLFWWS
jgi:hypothetical protein